MKMKRWSWRARRPSAEILGLLLVLMGLAPAAHAQLREVSTEVRIQAPIFIINNEAIRLQEVAEAAAEELAIGVSADGGETLHRGFGGIFKFLDWKPSNESTAPAARLVLDLLQDDSSFDSFIVLRYSAALGDGELVPLEGMLELAADSTLYTGLEIDFPSHDPNKLTDDLRTKIRKHYKAQKVQDFLEENVLSKILLAEDLDFDANRKKLALPESTRQLKASEKSIFKVQLVANNDDGHETPGLMLVAPLLPPPDHRAMIRYFRFDEVLVKDDEKTWHPQLANVLPKARADSKLWIFMQHYDEDLGLGGPSIPPPPPAPEGDVDF